MKRKFTKLEEISAKVIEGGQGNYAKQERRFNQRSERAAIRTALASFNVDYNGDKFALTPLREKVGKQFNDRTRFLDRWFRGYVGTPWNDLHSKIKREMDTNSLRGRHLWNDHLKSKIFTNPVDVEKYTSIFHSIFYTDEHGLIQMNERKPKKKYTSYRQRVNKRFVSSFLRGRCIRQVGSKLFWFIPTDETVFTARIENKRFPQLVYSRVFVEPIKNDLGEIVGHQKKVSDVKFEGKSKSMEKFVPAEKLTFSEFYKRYHFFPGAMEVRQGKKLSNQEMKNWNKIPTGYQFLILNFNP